MRTQSSRLQPPTTRVGGVTIALHDSLEDCPPLKASSVGRADTEKGFSRGADTSTDFDGGVHMSGKCDLSAHVVLKVNLSTFFLDSSMSWMFTVRFFSSQRF
jgi:hypothetical protein